MFRYGAFLAPKDPAGTWVFNEDKQEIRRYKRKDIESVGDMKITYHVIKGFKPNQGIKVTAVGV